MENQPLVGVIMGSDSDLPKAVAKACETLEELGIPYEVGIKSAHRTPEEMRTYVQTARGRGLKVIIAAAGGAAHLAGMSDAFKHGSLPVIGLPVMTSTLAGIDSLFAMAQMPPGKPVGVMQIDGGRNAALYAAEIIALSDEALAARIEAMKQKLHDEVTEKDTELRELGARAYMEKHGLL